MSKIKKILIIGAGFAGVSTAKNLIKTLSKSERKNIQIELINTHNYFVFQPLLPEVSAGIINPHDAVSPLRMLLPKIKHRLAILKNIDPKNNCVEVFQGRHKKRIKVKYNELVIACGQESKLNLSGFSEHSFTIKDLSDAFLLRNQVLKCLELADVTTDAVVKQNALTFVMVGAGFSGVETIGELQDMVKRTLKYYPNIKLTEVHFILIQRGKRILEQLPPTLADYAHKKLQKRGIDIRLNTGVLSLSAEQVITDDGQKISSHTIISTIGTAALDFVERNFDLERGKICVNNYMQVLGHNNIWALGDAALIPMGSGDKLQYAPPTAQFAIREAKILAYNLSRHLSNKPPKAFHFKPIGAMASLGAYQGVAQIYQFQLSGILAWAIWRGLYISKVPGIIAKIRITLNWMMDYFFPRTLVQLTAAENRSIKHFYFSKGDIICEADEVAGRFYLIISGSVLCEDNGKTKILKAQQYFGTEHTNLKISALENTKILSIDSEQFTTLRQDFKQFNDLF